MSVTADLNSTSHQTFRLDWTQRPEDLEANTTRSHLELTKQSVSGWGYYNGSTSYCICDVDGRALLKKMILQAYPKQKEFCVLDIGAGNFQWSQAVADFIEKQTDLPKDIKVHIVGVRAERMDNCTSFNPSMTQLCLDTKAPF